jgi:hypothetical protein
MADITNKTQNLSNTSVVFKKTAPQAITSAPRLLNNYLNSTLPGAGNKILTESQTRFPQAANQFATTLNNKIPGAGNGIGDPTVAPAKATAAPSGNTGYMFTGLAEALNTYQNNLVKEGTYAIADIYEFEFKPKTLEDKKVKNPGSSTDRSKTAGKQATTARQALDSNTVPVNNNSQNWNIQAGTQIVQLIDQIMRSSDYIKEQANTVVNAVTQETEASKGTGTGTFVWYNVSVQVNSLGHDYKRNDFAYRMKFLITPYAVTKMVSEYFPDSQYRGSHKSYNYWFTGKNSQIISFEQKYDASYRIILSGRGPEIRQNVVTTQYRDGYSKTAMPTTNQKTGQQTGTYTNVTSDSAADFLYSPTDYAIAKIRIVGDPAWLQQGTIATGVDNFNFRPFNADDGINYDSQMVNFDINWNQPQDYNFDTGIMNVNDTQGRPSINNTYVATECRSFFSRGKFEQEIEGKLLIESKPIEEVTARPGAKQTILPEKGPNTANKTALAGIVGSSTQDNAFVGYRSLRSAAVRRAAILDPNAYDSTNIINPLDSNGYGNG